MFGSSMPSLSDIAAVTGNRNNEDGFGGNNGWWVLIILFALFGGWGRNGYGNGGDCGNQAPLTRSDLCQDMNFNNLDAAVRGIGANADANFRTVDNAICTLGYNNAQLANGIQMQIANGFNNVDTNLCQVGNNVAQQFNALSTQLANCCCETNQNIERNTTQGVMNTNAIQQQIQQCCCDTQMRDMQSQFATQQQHCETMQAIDRVGDRIIDYMSAQNAQQLRDENQALRLAASQAAQNQYLIQQLRPCPEPAYVVPNPYCCNGYNNFNGCN